MPSAKPNAPEEGFRRQAWGFNRDDVLAYVNALASEAQQQQLEYEEQVKQLQAQVDKLKKEQLNARACVEKLQSDLQQQTDRTAQAEQNLAESEKKLADSREQLKVSESRANGYMSRYQQSQRTMLEWQNKCHELEQRLQAAAAQPAPSSAEPAPEPLPEPPAPPALRPEPRPEPAPEPARPTADETASIQARKILADARILADSTARRMQQEADAQKARMAENARDLAAGVLVLRERLSRVDEKLSAAALDLDNATAAIYAALDNTDADLKNLGVRLDAFASGKPEDTPPRVPDPTPAPQPAQPVQEPAAMAGAARPAARRVRPAPKAKPAKPAPPPRRLRTVHSGRRAVAQSLRDAMGRIPGEDGR